ncbi:hypothetical protein KSS87_017442 [Heliosperma pusillum]|nr:hypothetical protein KSS87_017442 [Heliosperma pusillum]
MEKAEEIVPRGLKRLNLIKSFRQSVRSLLTAFPFEDFSKAFPNFSEAQQDRLYQLYIQDEFETLCQETQVGTILDTVEHFVEQQRLDPLSSQKTNIKQVKDDLLTTKKNEIFFLQDLLDKAEDEKHRIKARISLLKETHEETSVTTDAFEKLQSMMANHSSYNGRL